MQSLKRESLFIKFWFIKLKANHTFTGTTETIY